MMTLHESELSAAELAELVARVFEPKEDERSIGILVDLPDSIVPDNHDWRVRRELALDWFGKLGEAASSSGLEPRLYLYRNAHGNNADLPDTVWRYEGGGLPLSADTLDPEDAVEFEQVFRNTPIFLAPTEFSATAPLKNAAGRFMFRAATMPGFAPNMVPALRLDYGEVNRRVSRLKSLVDMSEEATFRFVVDKEMTCDLKLDLRHRIGHASGGSFPESGHAGNLPSGEAYIVPYEGEIEDDSSLSAGVLPVQFGDEVVLYKIEKNKAVAVLSEGARSEYEADYLKREPAYANLAELGLGVLDDFGLEPTGEILLDEKLGLHIAFGRSDHFGGHVGPGDFSAPDKVVHIDRVYVPAIQPRVSVCSVDLLMAAGTTVPLIRDDRYVISW